MNLLNGTVQVCTCFVVYSEDICATVFERLNITLRLNDHQMHIHDLITIIGHGFNHWHSVADVRNKYAVHDIDVEPIGLAFIDHLTIALQIAEIRG